MISLNKENLLLQNDYQIVGGVDEAGRGPLAGPVVASIVSLDLEFYNKVKSVPEFELIRDSKKLTKKKRVQLFDIITKEFCEIGIGICDNQTIDRINILQATFLAMKKAIGQLKKKPSFVLIDGKFPIPNISIKQEAIIHGDDLVFSIAAASIIAKVTRDRIMEEYHQKYPIYGFDKHKGYGTKMHIAAIKKYGICPIHRKTFKPISLYF